MTRRGEAFCAGSWPRPEVTFWRFECIYALYHYRYCRTLAEQAPDKKAKGNDGVAAGPVDKGGGPASASLVDQCYSTLTSGKCNWEDLEALPQSMLHMMLKRCTEERAGLAVSLNC